MPTLSSTRLAVIALAALAAVAALAPAAKAEELIEACPTTRLEQPFEPWLDPMDYTMIPGGHFESGTRGWQVSGGRVTSGNESYFVRSGSDERSLTLPEGASARTPWVCAGLQEPTLRFFARATDDDEAALLAVEVLFTDLVGTVRSLSMGVVAPDDEWHPSVPHPVLVNLLALLPGSQAPVSFRFTVVGEADVQLDDVYLDPQMRN